MTCTTQENRRSRSFKQAAEKHWWKNSEAVFTAAWIGHQKLQEFALENHTEAGLGHSWVKLFSLLDKQICSFNLKVILTNPHDDFHRCQKVILRKLQRCRLRVLPKICNWQHPFFCQLPLYLSQNWGSDDHFEVLNGSKPLLVQKFSYDTNEKHVKNAKISKNTSQIRSFLQNRRITKSKYLQFVF